MGASVRAAAWSALRAGFDPVGIDLFADFDLTAVATASVVPRGAWPEASLKHFDARHTQLWMYTGALENYPLLVDELAQLAPLAGNHGESLRLARNPFLLSDALTRAGLPTPKVRANPNGLPLDGSWLVKPLASAGGRCIRPLDGDCGFLDEPTYFQARIHGEARSAIFLAHRHAGTVECLGVSKQLLGRGRSKFAYRGGVGPLESKSQTWRILRSIGETFARTCALHGLFGVDFVQREGIPWPVELNPRYTASCELFELARRFSMVGAHLAACGFGHRQTQAANADPKTACVGKWIVCAPDACRVPHQIHVRLAEEVARAHKKLNWEQPPRFADVPPPGARFDAGEPVLTLIELAPDASVCLKRLSRRARRWRRWLRSPASQVHDERGRNPCRS